MKTIIAGSREINDSAVVVRAIEASGYREQITEVVSGCAGGVDRLGEEWAASVGLPVKIFAADWDRYGPVASPTRNGQMSAYAEALIAVWNGVSRGTADMIQQARERGLAVYVHRVEAGEPASCRTTGTAAG